MTGAGPTVQVHLRSLPVQTWARSQEQTEGLLREFALIAAEEKNPGAHPQLPARLLELVDALNASYGGLTGEQEAQLWEAARVGQPVIDDLVYEVPPEAAGAAQTLGQMLDEADDYCRAGQHLLTLAGDAETVRFRWWFLGQFIGQTAGSPAVAWPDYR